MLVLPLPHLLHLALLLRIVDSLDALISHFLLSLGCLVGLALGLHLHLHGQQLDLQSIATSGLRSHDTTLPELST